MKSKPALAVAGLFMAGAALAGCENSRPYYSSGKSYDMSSAGFTQASPYYPQTRTVNSASMARTSEPPLDHGTGGVETTASLQVVNGTNNIGQSNGTPMLTITLPAVKVMVPINGNISYTPPTANQSASMPANDMMGAMPSMATAPTMIEPQIMRAAAQTSPTSPRYAYASGQTTGSVLQYANPPNPTSASSTGYAGGQAPSMNAGNGYSYSSGPSLQSGDNQGSMGMSPGSGMSTDSMLRSSRQSQMSPPPPVWPRGQTVTDDLPAPDWSNVPPPVRRAPSLYSSPPPQTSQNPYYQP